MELSKHPLVEKLRSLQFPHTDYVVAGSGPMLAHGLRENVRDLDIVARGVAWNLALKLGDPVAPPSGHGRMILLFEGAIEIFDRWLPGAKDPDELIESAELIEGIPFCPLQDVLEWKIRSDRQKDRVDVKLIKEYLERH
ncbi:hypothetical protein ACFWAT_07230 [Streptomyces syringium]|uniref:hypothetical protein n=1 Tax=Streptomyces syringium TaxID=76729 RepID=UPI00364FC728